MTLVFLDLFFQSEFLKLFLGCSGEIEGLLDQRTEMLEVFLLESVEEVLPQVDGGPRVLFRVLLLQLGSLLCLQSELLFGLYIYVLLAFGELLLGEQATAQKMDFGKSFAKIHFLYKINYF